jgi:hypothetical protein
VRALKQGELTLFKGSWKGKRDGKEWRNIGRKKTYTFKRKKLKRRIKKVSRCLRW